MKKFLILLCFTPLWTYSQTQFAKVALHIGCDSLDFITVKIIPIPENKYAILVNIVEIVSNPDWYQPGVIITDLDGDIISITRLENGYVGSDIAYYDDKIFIAGKPFISNGTYAACYLANFDLNGNLNWQKEYLPSVGNITRDRIRMQIHNEQIYLSEPHQGSYVPNAPNGYSSFFHLVSMFDLNGNFIDARYFGTPPIDYGQLGSYDDMWDLDYSLLDDAFAAVGATTISNSQFSSIHFFDPSLNDLGFFIDNTPSDILYQANYFDQSNGDLIMAGQNSTSSRITKLSSSLTNLWSYEVTVDNKLLNIYDVIPGADSDIILVGYVNNSSSTYRTCVIVFSSDGTLKNAFYHVSLPISAGYPIHSVGSVGSSSCKDFYYSESTGLIGIENVEVSNLNYSHNLPEIFGVNPYNPNLCVFEEASVQLRLVTTKFELTSSDELTTGLDPNSLTTEIHLKMFSTPVCIEGDTAFYYVDTASSGSRIAATTENAARSENLQKQENQTSLVYPNPNSNEFSLNLSNYQESSEVSIRILSLDGKIMMEKKLEGGLQQSLVAHRLKPGIYLVQLNGQTKEKLVVQ